MPPSTKLKVAFQEISREVVDDSCTPSCIKTFLKKHLDVHRFDDKRKVYLMLATKRSNDFLSHLTESYALINFWKHLCLSMVEETDHSLERIQNGLESFIGKMLSITGEYI